MADLVFIGLIVFLAAAVQGLSGFGSALVAMPLLSLILEVIYLLIIPGILLLIR